MGAIDYRGLDIPLTRMGAVSSDDLFEAREQAIFDFYERNRGRYRRAVDIGANIGIHAILMARQGWHVRAFEPDPGHFMALLANCKRNDMPVTGDVVDPLECRRPRCSPAVKPFNADSIVLCATCGLGSTVWTPAKVLASWNAEMLGRLGSPGHVEAVNAAVSLANGSAEFVQVLGNGTANHLAGARGAYGEQRVIDVRTVDCRALWDWADFVKVDCEGHEAALLTTVSPAQALRVAFMVEIGSARNAEAIFEHFTTLGVPMFAQGRGWQRIRGLGQMPTHYTQGSVFIGGEWK